MQLVAGSPPLILGASIDTIRSALLDERWADALVLWMSATGKIVDVYADHEMWTNREFGEEISSLELRAAPIFDQADEG